LETVHIDTHHGLPKDGTEKEMLFYVVMTVLIAAVSIYLVAH